ncbi:hypothetical protein KVR01_000968 [Diaporthe batatas]|uniref:uncharacterized protein n=1 Tax=Diaporthe batatas TaxID=748121 RepID=UPI001D04BE8F|nr:uncharacterized protein KVR01_000968 [Diaporthe batatas]KAG8170223.1 hypothetical protein KVR01_000968 [Diaporthe batatas]
MAAQFWSELYFNSPRIEPSAQSISYVMADLTGNTTPGELIRRFSWDMESRENPGEDSVEFKQLRSDFVEHIRASMDESETEAPRLDRYFSKARPGDEEAFKKTKAGLHACMQAFQALVPEELGVTVIPASWSDVELAVSAVQEHWESQSLNRSSRAREWLRKMCNGLNNHKAVLDLLPKESEYVSVIAGAVVMIIKASANYTKISESFANGVIAINDAVALVQDNQVYNTPRLQELSMRLYTGVFRYLTNFMTWFRSKSMKRLLWSLNENLAQTFADDIQQVKSTSTLISQQIQVYMSMDVRISKLQGRETNSVLKHLIALLENGEAQRRLQVATHERMFEKMLTARFQRSDDELDKVAAKVLDGIKEAVRQTVSGQAIGNILERQASMETGTDDQISSDVKTRNFDDSDDKLASSAAENFPLPSQHEQDIKFWSAHLEDHYDSEQIYPFPEEPQGFYAETRFVSRLSEFTTSPESQVLYAMSRFRPLGLNLLRVSAAKYAALSRSNDVPVISFFCLPLLDDPGQHIALLYALIRQTVELLDESTSRSMDSVEEKVKSLEGTVDTWDAGLELFSELAMRIRLPQLVFVIDGINLLEDDSDHAAQERISGIVGVLKDLACPGAVPGCHIKLLLTTAGWSTCLCEELDSHQIVVCDISSPVGQVPRRSKRSFLY